MFPWCSWATGPLYSLLMPPLGAFWTLEFLIKKFPNSSKFPVILIPSFDLN